LRIGINNLPVFGKINQIIFFLVGMRFHLVNYAIFDGKKKQQGVTQIGPKVCGFDLKKAL
jgi:hypothetical protein